MFSIPSKNKTDHGCVQQSNIFCGNARPRDRCTETRWRKNHEQPIQDHLKTVNISLLQWLWSYWGRRSSQSVKIKHWHHFFGMFLLRSVTHPIETEGLFWPSLEKQINKTGVNMYASQPFLRFLTKPKQRPFLLRPKISPKNCQTSA